MEERIQKIMAQAGLGSRRDCEEFIIAGRVRVNGILAEIGQKADPAVQTITLDGRAIKAPEEKIYIALHKPRYVLSTVDAEKGDSRQTVRDLVPVSVRLYPVGRLDFDSEGLILMTNDGELAQKLTHPSYQHSKEYRVLLARQPDSEQLATWQRGVVLEDGYKTQRAEVRIESLAGKGAWIRVIMREGRKRQIREIGSMLGLPVVRIVRIRIGNLNLGELKPAEWRYLSPAEILSLKEDRPGLGPYPDMTRKTPVKVRPRLDRKNRGRTAPPSGLERPARKQRQAGPPDRSVSNNRSSADGAAPSRSGRPPSKPAPTFNKTRGQSSGNNDESQRKSSIGHTTTAVQSSHGHAQGTNSGAGRPPSGMVKKTARIRVQKAGDHASEGTKPAGVVRKRPIHKR